MRNSAPENEKEPNAVIGGGGGFFSPVPGAFLRKLAAYGERFQNLRRCVHESVSVSVMRHLVAEKVSPLRIDKTLVTGGITRENTTDKEVRRRGSSMNLCGKPMAEQNRNR